jgi:competence protein ComK
MYMVGYYDRNGKLCTIVEEVDEIFIIDQSPLQILEYSINCIGFDLKGATATSKWLLGDIHMCPIMVNPLLNISLFPSKSSKHHDTMWFNPHHIKRTRGYMRKTTIEFTNGLNLIIPCKLTYFNNKLQNAEQLRKMTYSAGTNPVSFVLDPKKRKVRK